MSHPGRPAAVVDCTRSPTRPDAVVDTTRSLKRKTLAADQHDDLDALDGIFKRIKTAVPRAPYVLATPSLHPYCYHSRQEAYAWMLGHLWRHDEEHMQYRTYLYREPCQDCFELQAGEDEEPAPERPRAQGAKPEHQQVKRKPNLSAFKVKQSNGTLTPGANTSSPHLAPTKPAPERSNGVATAEKHSAPTQKLGAKSPARPSHGACDERPPGKPKPESTPGDSRLHTTTPRPKTAHGLPPMLSPVEEPLRNPHGLPDILSPTLPTIIQAELDRQDVQRKRAESDASTSSSGRKSQSLAVPTAHARKSDGPAKAENRIRSVSVNGTSPNPAPVRTAESDRRLLVKLKFSKAKASTVKHLLRLPPKKKPEQKESHDVPAEQAKEKEVPVKVSEGPVIKKKPIAKVAARRGDTATLTTTPVPSASTSAKPSPTPTKHPEKRPRAEEEASVSVPSKRPRAEEEASVSVPSKRPRAEEEASVAVPSKRPRAEEEASLSVPSKRPRALSQQDRPITPVQATPSPAPSGKASSALKSQSRYLTPKKDPKGVGMSRTASSESYDATPGRSGATPAGAKAGPTSAPMAGKKQADISLLAQTSMKLNQMGRALKHEATKILTAGGRINKQDEKRAAVTNLECILSYMAAYYAQDLSLHLRNRPGEVEQTWKTLLPLCLSYTRCTKDFPHLDGLRSYLSSIIASAICTHVAQRGSNTRTTHDSPQDVAHAELAKQHTSAADNLALLSDHTAKMARHFQDARIALPMDDLQSTYTKTWAAQEPNLRLAREPERVSGARMSGPYFLPLGPDTTPIQAVRFGLRFLAEYCEREGIAYKLRVNLERGE